MNTRPLQEKIKDPEFKEEVLELLRAAVKNVTTDEFEILNQKLDRILMKLDLLIQKQDALNNPYTLRTLRPRKINS